MKMGKISKIHFKCIVTVLNVHVILYIEVHRGQILNSVFYLFDPELG